MSTVDDLFAQTVAVHQDTLAQSRASIYLAAQLIRSAFESGRKLLTFGNGGSAADAQHLASELVNRFQIERRGFAAVALTADTSVLTSIANDTSYDRVFSRQIEALGVAGDVALGISTSGRSSNVLAALRQARELRLGTVALIGSRDSACSALSDVCISVASASTARIQEVHRTILHALCELIESPR
jgi:D-sedoheptulose 7-phosphate isomerase